MSVVLPAGSTYDPLKARYWFDPLINDMTDKADRLAVYQAHRDAGDTVLNLSMGLDGLDGLPRLLDIAAEAITDGGLTGIWLMCMGDGHGQPNSDPGALGHDWLMAHFADIYALVKAAPLGDHSLADHVVFLPGYDGVVPDWQPPSSVDRFLLMARGVIDERGSGYLGLELSAGFCKWGTDSFVTAMSTAGPVQTRQSWKYAALQGRPEPPRPVESGLRRALGQTLARSAASEDNNWTTAAGRAVDLILQEGPIDMGPPIPCPPGPPQDRWSQVYQIVGRMVQPFHPVPGQHDDPDPPFLLGQGTPRGPHIFNWWETDTYRWTSPWRNGGAPMSAADVDTHRSAGYAMGCRYVG